MFEQSMVESTPLLRTQNRWPALVSVAMQAALAAVIVALPLLHPEILPFRTAGPSLLAPPPRPPQPPPPPQHTLRVESTTGPDLAIASQPARIQNTFSSTNAPVDAPTLAVGLNLGAARPNLPTSFLGTSPAGPHIVAGPTSVHPSSAPPVISTGVSAGLLLTPIRPEYPQIARITRTEGTVVVEAIISTSGRIVSARVISGPAMLRDAALQAIYQARYRPYLLNNQPTEVQTTFTIDFRLTS